MSVYEDIGRAIETAKRRLHNYAVVGEPADGGMRALFKVEQVNRLLRVEIDWDCLGAIRQALPSYERHLWFSAYGPWSAFGVDLYLATTLPAPGWRVINPMEKS